MRSKTYKKVVSISLILVMMLLMAVSCYAADDLNVGQNIYKFVKEQIYWIALVIAAIIIVPLFLKKAWVAMVTTLAGTALAIFFISDPEKIKMIGSKLYNIIFGA
ncbi:MAG: TcpD family membrane protein [Clostridia bacterium]|nr:TcpD family membrane protein [Clostridia bacterium]